MERGQQEVQPNIPLGRTWIKFPEDMSQRDGFQRPHGNHQRMESHQAVQTSEGGATRIRENQATIRAIEEQLTKSGNPQIPSGSQGVDQQAIQWLHTVQAPTDQSPKVTIIHNPR
ncbi:hypothetical protein O181_058993 [Austropuccinia psidii MF-1]|uniref:Uncharacterized protein n=1 Tax=Austropuccinia psidii MF-1 TaxID=1389203 RepID=A0A9Q3HW42_9BASI|nr:hypothetical protein [Austropuccinia psidii MF-1]